MASISMYLMLVTFVSAAQLEIIHPTHLKTQHPHGFSGFVLSRGRLLRSAVIAGDLFKVKECGEVPHRNAIALLDARKCDIESSLVAALQAEAKAMLVFHAGSDLRDDRMVSSGVLPILEIDSMYSDSLISYSGSIQLSISFPSIPSLAIVLALNTEADSNLIYLAGWLKDAAVRYPFEVFYTVPIGVGEFKVREILRQQCVKTLRGVPDLMAYLSEWMTINRTASTYGSALSSIGVTDNEIERCVDLNRTELLLAVDEDSRSSPMNSPGIAIDRQPYRGAMDEVSLEAAICKAFPDFSSCADTREVRRASEDNSTFCSPGCVLWYLNDGLCHKECDTLECDYGNWACRCSRECLPEMLSNYECDLACNTTVCSYDRARCLPQPESPPADSSIILDKDTSSSFQSWKLALIVVCGTLCITTCLLLLATAFVKLIRLRKQRSVMHVLVPSSESDQFQSVLNVHKVSFSPDLIDFETSTCAICLGDFCRDEGVVKTYCRHLFHFECLRNWLSMHLHCPICMRHPFEVLVEELKAPVERGNAFGEERKEEAKEEVKEEAKEELKEDGDYQEMKFTEEAFTGRASIESVWSIE